MDDRIAIGFLDKAHIQKSGVVKRQTMLIIDGKQQDCKTIRLDSEESCKRQAKRWAEAFGLDVDVLQAKLRTATLKAIAEVQDAQKARAEGPSGAELPPPHACTLDEAKEVFAKWLKLKDWTVLDVVLAVAKVHELEGDPLWLALVAPPGAIKTEITRSLSDHPSIYAVSTLSPNALISGYITDGPDPSLLPKLDGKVLTIKDFTAILQMQRDARGEIISMLRDCYDGEAARAFGTGETKSYRSRFGLIACVTPMIDDYSSVNAMLGERFLRYRLATEGTLDKIDQALKNTAGETTMRRELSRAAQGVLNLQAYEPKVPAEITEQIKHLANFLSTARSEVSRDRAGKVTYMPQPEVGTRVGKQLKKLAMGPAMARGLDTVDDNTYGIVARVAVDSLPSMRERLLRGLWMLREEYKLTQDIADSIQLDTDSCRRWLADLRLLGIVDRVIEAKNAHTWRLQQWVVDGVIEAQLDVIWGAPNSAPHGPEAKNGDSGDSVSYSTVGSEVAPLPHDITDGNPQADNPECAVGAPSPDDDSDLAEREAIQAVEAEEAAPRENTDDGQQEFQG
jgi:hypothetical protein